MSYHNLYSFDVSRKGVVTNDESILNALDNFFSIPKRSIPFNRELVIDLEQYLFEPFSFAISQLITDEIEDSLRRYFPQFKILEIEVDPRDEDRTYALELSIQSPYSGKPVEYRRGFKSHA